jgi:nitroimidazol reductase NimA-like FMN-containing flavoprotein (pyridoxamine 5'-phosphate oxidase superfamily)
MAKDYARLPLAEVRRQDRAVTDETWIRALLQRAPVGALATLHEGQPFINSNLFVYDETRHVIYMHTARLGRTQANVEADERVCFSVYEMGRLLPATTALEFSVEYAGVTVFGTAKIVSDPGEAAYGLQRLLDKYAPHLQPGRDYQPITAEELKRTAVYRIDIEAWSGKKKAVAAAFPGAFYYGQAGAI